MYKDAKSGLPIDNNDFLAYSIPANNTGFKIPNTDRENTAVEELGNFLTKLEDNLSDDQIEASSLLSTVEELTCDEESRKKTELIAEECNTTIELLEFTMKLMVSSD